MVTKKWVICVSLWLLTDLLLPITNTPAVMGLSSNVDVSLARASTYAKTVASPRQEDLQKFATLSSTNPFLTAQNISLSASEQQQLKNLQIQDEDWSLVQISQTPQLYDEFGYPLDNFEQEDYSLSYDQLLARARQDAATVDNNSGLDVGKTIGAAFGSLIGGVAATASTMLLGRNMLAPMALSRLGSSTQNMQSQAKNDPTGFLSGLYSGMSGNTGDPFSGTASADYQNMSYQSFYQPVNSYQNTAYSSSPYQPSTTYQSQTSSASSYQQPSSSSQYDGYTQSKGLQPMAATPVYQAQASSAYSGQNDYFSDYAYTDYSYQPKVAPASYSATKEAKPATTSAVRRTSTPAPVATTTYQRPAKIPAAASYSASQAYPVAAAPNSASQAKTISSTKTVNVQPKSQLPLENYDFSEFYQ